MKGGFIKMRTYSSILKKIKKDTRGVYGIEIAQAVIMGLFMLILVVIAILVGISTLRNSNLLTAASDEYNTTNALMSNVSKGTAVFAGNIVTFMTVIGIVIIMTFIGLMIYVVRKFAGSKGEQGL